MKRILILLVSVLVAFEAFGQDTKPANTPATSIRRLSQVLYYINNYYLDTVDFAKLTDQAIIATMEELDPHSTFISADEVKAMNEPLEGNFDGIGIEFAIIGDTLTVQATVAGGPSEKVGLLSGDKIVAVDGENVAGITLTNDKVYKYLRGPKGTEVELTVVRKYEKEKLLFNIVRDKIPLNSVDAAYQPEEGYLYVKLSRFASSSFDEINTAIKEMKGNMKGMILDLRGNSGGYLFAAIQIANNFLSDDQLIVYTEGRTVRSMREVADGTGNYKQGPLVILVDENSASASEIVAGAVQDWDRAIIVGRRTFGKGLVQQAMPLSDGSQLRLTIARYHTPSGRVIQSPYEKGHADQYYMDFYKRYSNGESFSRDSIHFPDSLKYKTLGTGRTVFGGGGIMPDIFVPADTTSYSGYYTTLLRRGVIIEYMNSLIDKNRDKWTKQYPTYEVFAEKFTITQKMFDGLIERGREKGIEPVQADIEISKNDMLIYMKSLAASGILTRDAFYRVRNSMDDPSFAKAMDVLRNWEKNYSELIK